MFNKKMKSEEKIKSEGYLSTDNEIAQMKRMNEPWYNPDPERDKNDIVLDSGVVFVDWNKFSMDELADYLEKKYMFLSSGEALAVMKMVDFYRENKKL